MLCQKKNILLQGNFDPSILLADNTSINGIVDQSLQPIKDHKNYLPSLGHGLMPHIDPNKVAHFIAYLKDYPWQLS